MSYCSDVSLVMNRNLFGEMLKQIPEAAQEIISCADRFSRKDDSILLVWYGIKWNTDSYPFYQIVNFLNDVSESILDEKGDKIPPSQIFRYHFLRIGEDREDFEERGEYWDNPWDTTIIRYIEVDSGGEDVELSAFL